MRWPLFALGALCIGALFVPMPPEPPFVNIVRPFAGLLGVFALLAGVIAGDDHA